VVEPEDVPVGVGVPAGVGGGVPLVVPDQRQRRARCVAAGELVRAGRQRVPPIRSRVAVVLRDRTHRRVRRPVRHVRERALHLQGQRVPVHHHTWIVRARLVWPPVGVTAQEVVVAIRGPAKRRVERPLNAERDVVGGHLGAVFEPDPVTDRERPLGEVLVRGAKVGGDIRHHHHRTMHRFIHVLRQRTGHQTCEQRTRIVELAQPGGSRVQPVPSRRAVLAQHRHRAAHDRTVNRRRRGLTVRIKRLPHHTTGRRLTARRPVLSCVVARAGREHQYTRRHSRDRRRRLHLDLSGPHGVAAQTLGPSGRVLRSATPTSQLRHAHPERAHHPGIMAGATSRHHHHAVVIRYCTVVTQGTHATSTGRTVDLGQRLHCPGHTSVARSARKLSATSGHNPGLPRVELTPCL
jgi:hypothetical protein